MPSLLMQAARSAAIADGLLSRGKNKSTGVTAKKAQQQVKVEAETQGKAPTGDTVAAALAMLAASNGGNPKISAAEASARLPHTDITRSRNNEIRPGVTPVRPAQTSALNSNIPSPALTVATHNLNNIATSSSGVSSSTSGIQSLRQSPAITQQKQRHSSFPAPGPAASNPASAGSAAHRLAVANSIPVAPKPNVSASSHIPQSAPPAPRSSSTSGGSGGKKKGPPLRRGKWTPEEEAYANSLIMEFKAGLLPLTDGTTLRTFLSKLLNCDPMRISKKFVGSNCIGKQVFRRRTADINRLTTEQIQQSRAELSE